MPRREGNRSNDNGRAWEYAVSVCIGRAASNPTFRFTQAAVGQRSLHEPSFNSLSLVEQRRYCEAAAEVVVWLERRFHISTDLVSLDWLGDHAGGPASGDVTDLRLALSNGNEVSLSLKHNNSALKHPRPASLEQWIGFDKHSDEDRSFRSALGGIVEEFLHRAHQLVPGATTFEQVKAAQSQLIETDLYEPVCRLVADSLRSGCSSETRTARLFSFLVGTHDYYKITLDGHGVHYQDFLRIDPPTSVSVETSHSYVFLRFSNGWRLSLRLHTASKALGNSLKFDARDVTAEA